MQKYFRNAGVKNPASIYLFKMNNIWKLTTKTPERRQLWTDFSNYSGVSTVKFEQVNAGREGVFPELWNGREFHDNFKVAEKSSILKGGPWRYTLNNGRRDADIEQELVWIFKKIQGLVK